MLQRTGGVAGKRYDGLRGTVGHEEYRPDVRPADTVSLELLEVATVVGCAGSLVEVTRFVTLLCGLTRRNWTFSNEKTLGKPGFVWLWITLRVSCYSRLTFRGQLSYGGIRLDRLECWGSLSTGQSSLSLVVHCHQAFNQGSRAS